MNKLYYLATKSLLVISIFIFVACGTNNPISKPKHNTSIAITKAHGSSSYEQYKIWLHELDSNIIIYDLYGLSLDSAKSVMKNVDGLLLSGGPDINPKLYGEDSMEYICETPDNYRDSLELQSIDYAYKNKIAILGICRGLQLTNVYFGGSLINDIPSQINSTIIHRGDTNIAYHNINIVNKTYFKSLYDYDSAWVNSSHHQAIKKLGHNLKILAFANDSIIESIGLKDNNYPNFFLAVQFHPEHLGSNNELAIVIGKTFIGSARIINQERK